MCSEFTGDGYSIGLVSVGELAHRPSGTYSGEAEKHGHEDKARRETVSGYTLSTNKRRTSTMGANKKCDMGDSSAPSGRHGGATDTALGWESALALGPPVHLTAL